MLEDKTVERRSSSMTVQQTTMMTLTHCDTSSRCGGCAIVVENSGRNVGSNATSVETSSEVHFPQSDSKIKRLEQVNRLGICSNVPD